MFKRLGSESGVTLVEITLALSIFAGIVAITAQSLLSFYVTLDIQEQRIEAIHSCRAVMGALREKRGDFKLEDWGYDWEGFIDWIEDENDEGWQAYVKSGDGYEELNAQQLTVTCFDMDGNAAVPGSNPIEVHVTTTWTDRKGRPMKAELVTAVSNMVY